jgi:hypothetical protein
MMEAMRYAIRANGQKIVTAKEEKEPANQRETPTDE